MEKRRLGRTDIFVSKICLGTMTFGEQNTEAEGHAQLDMALDCGVNFIDTAELYPIPPKADTQGRTERYIGNWRKARGNRDKVVLATKVVEWRARGLACDFPRGADTVEGVNVLQAAGWTTAWETVVATQLESATARRRWVLWAFPKSMDGTCARDWAALTIARTTARAADQLLLPADRVPPEVWHDA